MDCVVTVLVALGVMPLVLAMMAYLAAREFLLWPFFGARLWGVAVGLILVGLGLSPCKRFLKAGDHRQKQPHEVGRFVMRLFWLHALGALSVAMGYVLASVETAVNTAGWTREAPTSRPWHRSRGRVEHAKAESTARTLQAALTELRVESRRATETVAVWVERASRAETRLEELEKGAGRRS